MVEPDARGEGDAQDLTALRDQLERGFRRLTARTARGTGRASLRGAARCRSGGRPRHRRRHLQVALEPSQHGASRRPRSRRTHTDRRHGADRMTRHDDFDHTLAGWFESEAARPCPPESRACPRRHPPPQAPASVAGRSRQPLGRRGVRCRFRALAHADPALECGLVDSPHPAPGHGGPRGWGDRGGARLFEIAVANRSARSPRLRHRRRHLPGRLGRQELDPSRGRPSPRRPDRLRQLWGEGPMWSPDGRHFAYRSDWGAPCRATGSGKVHLSDAQGRVVASFPGTGWLVSWSPDSARVATWADLDRIGIYGVDGERRGRSNHRWDHGPLAATLTPNCCPTATRSSSVSIGRSGSSRWRRDLAGVATGRPSRLSGCAVSSRRSRSQCGIPGSLVVAAISGSERRVVVSASLEFNPMWSPTGDRIAFVERSQPIGDSFEGAISIVDVASGGLMRLASVRGTGPSPLLRFSPEGDRILFWRVEGVPSLWSVNADGSNARLLVTGADWVTGSLQPGGTR